ALLSCADSRAITRSGTLFDQTNPVIDKRMASQIERGKPGHDRPQQSRARQAADRLREVERIQHVHNVLREAPYETMQLIGKRRLGIL
ncbi:hypothetical protein ACWCQ0_53770, partial [Streptomyces massasporeus]